MTQTFNCPSCGAPLETDGDSLSVVCKYCGDTVSVPAEFRPQPVAPAPREDDDDHDQPSERYDDPSYAPPAQNNYGLAVGVVTVVVLVLFAILVGTSKPKAPPQSAYDSASNTQTLSYINSLITKEVAQTATAQVVTRATQQAAVATDQAASAAATLTATNAPETLDAHTVYSPVVIPAQDAGTTGTFPNFLVQDYEGYYVWADGAHGSILWKSNPLTGQGSQVRAFIVEKQVLIFEQNSISALDLQTGQTVWKAALPASLGNCVTCLVQSGSTLLALLKDGTLQAWDAASGKAAWHKTLKGSYTDLFLSGGLPAVLVQNAGRWSMSVIDPPTGNLSQTIQPTCQGGGKVPGLMNLVDLGAGQKELFVLGAGCLQIISLPAGKVMAQVNNPQYASDPESIWLGNSYLVTPGIVYYASASKAVYALDLTGGAAREMLSDPNYDLKPLQLMDKVLVVDTKPGAASVHQYWGVDTNTGQNLWNFPVEGQAIVHFLSNGDVFIYKWQVGARQWTEIDPRTGQDVYQTQVVSGGGLSYDFTWYNDTVYIVRDHRLMVMDALTGKSPSGHFILY